MSAPGIATRAPATRDRGDEVLRRLPFAAWRALPVLALTGVGAVLLGVGVMWALGPASAWVPAAVGLLAAPLLMWAVQAVHSELFADPLARGWRRGVLVAAAATATPGLLASASLLAAAVAEATHAPLFQVVAVAGSLATAVVAAIAVVALPLGLVRGEVRLGSVVVVAVLATVRRPLAAIATLAAASAVTWLGVTWFAGVLVAAVPALAVLAVATSWTTVVPFGVELPELTPVRTRRRPAPQGER